MIFKDLATADEIGKLSRANIGFILLIFKICTDTFPCNKLVSILSDGSGKYRGFPRFGKFANFGGGIN